jgi:CDP-diacylglycerol--serine O-phosphatidyltransferase
MIFGALRLARFNIQLVGFDKDYFSGLPIPASALTVASFTLNYYSEASGLDSQAAFFLPWLSVVLGLLMVSKVKYDTLPKISRRALNKEPWKFVFAGLAIIVVFITGGNAIFPLLLLFIVLGLVRYVITSVRRIMTRPHAKYEDDEAVEPTRVEP